MPGPRRERGGGGGTANGGWHISRVGLTSQMKRDLWPQCWIYTTAEPCPMCGAVILHCE